MPERVLDVGIAERALDAAGGCGDAAVVKLRDDVALVAAIDGLGHGPEAARAAGAAAALLDGFAGEPLADLVGRCHAALHGTRGAALTVASFSPAAATMSWIGVGNVEARLIGASPRIGGMSASLLLLSGTVGYELPRLTPSSVALRLGDTLVLATDGIDGRFADVLDTTGTAQQIAARILERHARPADDALVVVARFLGGGR